MKITIDTSKFVPAMKTLGNKIKDGSLTGYQASVDGCMAFGKAIASTKDQYVQIKENRPN